MAKQSNIALPEHSKSARSMKNPRAFAYEKESEKRRERRKGAGKVRYFPVFSPLLTMHGLAEKRLRNQVAAV